MLLLWYSAFVQKLSTLRVKVLQVVIAQVTYYSRDWCFNYYD